MSNRSINCHPRHKKNRDVENVLVMQGGGSLGAFSCGVLKALVKENVKIDIVAGTSIGAINAAIIAGSKSDHPEIDLEDFWIELAESNYEYVPDTFSFFYDFQKTAFDYKKVPSASFNASMFGVPKMFLPRWNPVYMFKDKEYFTPQKWTFFYDHTPLIKTLDKYIDYRKLSPNTNKKALDCAIRLIVTSVNVLTAEPLIFDSAKIPIKAKHLLASSGYPNYGFPWTEVENGVFAWDGSLLSNTPVREVISASPRNDKHIFIVENYPRDIDRLPSNMTEVFDRAKDIMFCDKTQHSLQMSKIITRQIQLIEKLYDFFEKSDKTALADLAEQERIKKEYNELVNNHGAEIHSVTRITRNRLGTPNISKNADFSIRTIKDLISQGERKTLRSIKKFKENKANNYVPQL